MHQTSIDRMTEFRDKYLDVSKHLDIIDIGSRDDLQAYRKIFINSIFTIA